MTFAAADPLLGCYNSQPPKNSDIRRLILIMDILVLIFESATELVGVLVAIVGFVKSVLDFLKKIAEVVSKKEVSFPTITLAPLFKNSISETNISFIIILYLIIILPSFTGQVSEKMEVFLSGSLPPTLLTMWTIAYLANSGWGVFWIFISNLWGILGYSNIGFKLLPWSTQWGLIANLIWLSLPTNAVILIGFSPLGSGWSWFMATLITVLNFVLFFVLSFILPIIY